jgi:hypothetical protein
VPQHLKGSEQGLVGYWKLNEGPGGTVFDSTVAGNHGPLMGARASARAHARIRAHLRTRAHARARICAS